MTFTATAPNHTWVTDFTYVNTWTGWVYVAFIIDVFSQKIIAWHAQTTKRVQVLPYDTPADGDMATGT